MDMSMDTMDKPMYNPMNNPMDISMDKQMYKPVMQNIIQQALNIKCLLLMKFTCYQSKHLTVCLKL